MATKTTKTTKTSTKANKGKKGKPAKKAADYGTHGLTPNQMLVLDALKRNTAGLTRPDLRTKTKIEKGFSKLLGAHTEKVRPGSLIGEGFVKVHMPDEGERAHLYTITAKGKTALEKAKAAK